ncbi:hypothetical protein DPSP01_007870 [Paraphaeosphaeria sporulosa]|uniref:DUF647-domain-containing protein n=1 Tax=Paraphaeosphaeria sporulosa TaxID=1460663 RepID=A0A177CKE4_9PLEO|nr:DUF647-domain-containing protein [Paraphaeosphaeria sporulosa]OAG07310.1 DUF647-domain-containing protein [Paraphaeosphaeria sporulosa]
MSSAGRLELSERDDAGHLTVTFIETAAGKGGSRVDAVRPRESKTYAQQLLEVFLPAGYPHTVTEDYIQYQIYDSLQAFSSSIAGLLSSRAVLEGVGVGDADASPTAALLLSVLQESMGRIATILFAHRLGTSLEPECKMYRLAADVFNDTAMILDCLSPAFPKATRVLILSFSSVLRSLCGVCAGSSKASLSAHFAKRGNLGELNAKDSSQETVISLLGMLAGSIVVSWIKTPMATWSTLIALLSIHLATNYAAVKSVSMRSLNRQRANIVLSSLLRDGRILSPAEVSARERIFERDGALRWIDGSVLGHCRIGAPLENMLHFMGHRRHKRSGAVDLQDLTLADLVRVYQDEAYLLWSCGSAAVIVLKQDCSPLDQLKAWTQALLLARKGTMRDEPKAAEHDTSGGRLAELRFALEEVKELFDAYETKLRDAGWDLDVAVLESRPGVRVQIKTEWAA